MNDRHFCDKVAKQVMGWEANHIVPGWWDGDNLSGDPFDWCPDVYPRDDYGVLEHVRETWPESDWKQWYRFGYNDALELVLDLLNTDPEYLAEQAVVRAAEAAADAWSAYRRQVERGRDGGAEIKAGAKANGGAARSGGRPAEGV